MEQYTVIKYKDQIGYVEIPSKKLHGTADIKTGFCTWVYSLNSVRMEDNSVKLLGDDDMEVIDDDRSRKFIEEINKLYNK